MQFDVFTLRRSDSDGALVVDIQADLLSALPTCLVAPLIPSARFGRNVSRLHPLLVLAEEELILATHLVAAVERRHLRHRVGSLAAYRDTIVAAVDVLLAGI